MTHSREIIVITYQKDQNNIEEIKRSIQAKFKIPAKLFSFKEVESRPCKTISKESFLHLCLDGEKIRTLHINNKVLKNSFSIFTR